MPTSEISLVFKELWIEYLEDFLVFSLFLGRIQIIMKHIYFLNACNLLYALYLMAVTEYCLHPQ